VVGVVFVGVGGAVVAGLGLPGELGADELPAVFLVEQGF